MVVSCADPGIFARGGGRGSKKILITFFRHQLFYSFTEGYQWFILRKTIFLRLQRASNILQGRGSKFFRGGGGGGGGGANVNIELVNFQGGGSGPLDPRMRMIDPLASSVKPIPKDRFSHAMANFSLLEQLVTLGTWFWIFHLVLHCTLYEISMRWYVNCGKQN